MGVLRRCPIAMRTSWIWIEILMVGSAVALALALLIAVLGVVVEATAEAFPQPETKPAAATQTYEGVITCSRCGARHSARLGKNAAQCARVCIRAGADLALVDGDRMYALDGQPDVVRNVIGQRARIAGVIRGNKIKVVSVQQANP